MENKLAEWEKCTWTTALLPLISRTCPLLTVPSPRTTFTISAYLLSQNPQVFGPDRQRGWLLREFDIIEDDQRSVDFDDCSVINSGRDVVISGGCRLVNFVDVHTTAVVTASVMSHLF
jgi:hypothetical protein